MLRAILFDFNGVLVDDEPLHFELFGKVLADEGIELSKEDYYEHYLGFDDRGAFEAIFGRLGRSLDIGHLMRLITRKSAYYQRVIHEKGYPFFPGAVDLVRDCAAADLMLGVVSGALREEVEGALARARARLDNPSFVEKAPEAVVDGARRAVDELSRKREHLIESLEVASR